MGNKNNTSFINLLKENLGPKKNEQAAQEP